eukprot:GHRQ01006454.1.p2 GENE.GHRQ01006454.1~~GHRQ01006454.1.p2  ORF type:complete len:254 (+),score=18.76 GHRQ01006454.1:253-1014(+)
MEFEGGGQSPDSSDPPRGDIIATRSAVAADASPAGGNSPVSSENLLRGLDSDEDMGQASGVSQDHSTGRGNSQDRREVARLTEEADVNRAKFASLEEENARLRAALGTAGQQLSNLIGLIMDTQPGNGAQDRQPDQQRQQQQGHKRGRSVSRDRNGAGSSYAAAARRGQSSSSRQQQGGTSQQTGRQGYGSPSNVRTFTNANGQQFSRSAHVVSWMVKQQPQPCWCCFAAGHRKDQCTASPARGNPANYTPPQ